MTCPCCSYAIRLLVTSLALIGVSSVSAWAGTNPNAVFALHAKAHTTKPVSICTTRSPNSGTPIPCTSYVTQWPLATSADVYLVVARGDSVTGIVGASCGVQYNQAVGMGVDMHGWTLCADLESISAGPNGGWPNSGGGNRMTWVASTNCQRTVAGDQGVHAVAGAFYVYAYGTDVLNLTENKNVAFPELAVANCSGHTDHLPWARVAFVTFSAGGVLEGCNPCTEPNASCERPVPALPTTWSNLKQRFGG